MNYLNISAQTMPSNVLDSVMSVEQDTEHARALGIKPGPMTPTFIIIGFIICALLMLWFWKIFGKKYLKIKPSSELFPIQMDAKQTYRRQDLPHLEAGIFQFWP